MQILAVVHIYDICLRVACEQAPSEVGKKFGEWASGSQSVVTPRAKQVGRGGACRHCFQCTVPPLSD